MTEFDDLCVITVFYKNPTHVKRFFESFLDTYSSLPCQFLVADNSENSVCLKELEQYQKLYPENIKTFAFPNNPGFSFSNNSLARESTRKSLCFLNPDVVIEEDFISPCLESLDRLGGLISPLTRDYQGKVYKNYGPFYHAKPYLLAKIYYALKPEQIIEKVDWLQGACLFCHKIDFDLVGGFDQRYFLYTEDMQLARDFSDIGLDSFLDRRSSIKHQATYINEDQFSMILENLKIYFQGYCPGSYLNYLRLQAFLKLIPYYRYELAIKTLSPN